jgi:N,N-dimethylformamidase beta subunit-like protein
VNHIVFVVRDDARASDLLFQTSDATWQAYNSYGGSNLYRGTTRAPAGRAFKASYNRPLMTRNAGIADRRSSLFTAEYPMLRWLERNDST